MKLQWHGDLEKDRFIYITNLKEYVAEIRKNKDKIEKEKTLKLVNTTMSHTYFKNLGFEKFKVKTPDFYVIRDISVHENSFKDVVYRALETKTLDWSPAIGTPVRTNVEHVDSDCWGHKLKQCKDYFKLIEPILNIDSDKIWLEDDVITKFEEGSELDDYKRTLLKSTGDANIITQILSTIKFSKENKYELRRYVNNVNTKIIKGRDLKNKAKIYDKI